MTLTIELPADVAERLTRDAAETGLSVAEHTVQLLREFHQPTAWGSTRSPAAPADGDLGHEGADATLPDAADVRTGAELVAYWQAHGLIGSDTGTEDSSAMSRRLRAEIENERRERRP